MPVCGINVTHVRAGSATGAWAERLGLSSLDSSFLRVETPTAHMHVGWLSTLELPTRAEQLDPAALIEQIAGRLHVAPRFRQRVVQSPPSLAEPSWEDDGSFHILRHVHVVDEPWASSRRLAELTDGFLSRAWARSPTLLEDALDELAATQTVRLNAGTRRTRLQPVR
jgi:hypothetical protein